MADVGGPKGPGNESDPNCYIPQSLEALDQGYQIFLVALYSLTSVSALLGNVTVILVEMYGRHSAHNLRYFLINLAISDIIIGVFCVPFTYTDFMLGRWIFPEFLCPVAQVVQLISVFVTAFTLTIIGIERLVKFIFSNFFCDTATHLKQI